MKGRVLIIHWDEKEGAEIKEGLEELGLEVQLETEDGMRAYRTMEQNKPDVVIVYLTRRSLKGISSVASLLDRRTLTDVPMFFIGEESDKISRFRQSLEGSSVLPEERMIATLKEILDRKWA